MGRSGLIGERERPLDYADAQRRPRDSVVGIYHEVAWKSIQPCYVFIIRASDLFILVAL